MIEKVQNVEGRYSGRCQLILMREGDCVLYFCFEIIIDKNEIEVSETNKGSLRRQADVTQ